MNNTQLVVRLNNADENFDLLERHGFCNVQRLTKENYDFPVIVIDLPSKKFFGTNTACMAAMKPKVVDFSRLFR